MSRPSRNVDQLLIAAGNALLPLTGVRGLSIRAVTERAGVNLGMFHYHFKSKDTFVRAILEQTYNGMFAGLEMAAHRDASARENLRASLNMLARFGRDNRQLIVRLLGDALAGNGVATEFLRTNMPRHIAVIIALLHQAQRDGELRKLPVAQAIAFLLGSVAAPLLIGTAAINSGLAMPALAEQVEDAVFTDTAIAERVDMALSGMVPVPQKGSRK